MFMAGELGYCEHRRSTCEHGYLGLFTVQILALAKHAVRQSIPHCKCALNLVKTEQCEGTLPSNKILSN